MDKARIALFSPLSPVASGVSEYTEDLLPELSRHFEIDLFVAQQGIGASLRARFNVLEASSFPERAGEYALAVYQMGNNVHHAYMYDLIKEHPGIAVLHDTVLHHFYIEIFLASGNPGAYLDLMERCYGEPGRRVAEGRIDDIYSDMQYFHFPLNEEIALSSSAVIVHNEHGRRELLRKFPELKTATVPMGIARLDNSLPSREMARKKLGLPENGFIAGSFGFITGIKRVDVLLKALSRLRDRIPGLSGLIIGEASAAMDLEGWAEEFGVSDCVRFTGYIEREEIPWHIAATDVFVNLRYPTAGETSASLLKLLAMGKPVIVSGFKQFWDLPDEVCPKIRPGAGEVEALSSLLGELAADPAARERLSLKARRYVEEHHSVAHSAAAYAEIISRAVSQRWRPLGLDRSAPWVSIPWRRSRVGGRVRARMEGTSLPGRVRPGQRLCLGVKATNTGDTLWMAESTPFGGFVALSGLLRHPDGTSEELRWVTLPADLAPGDSCELRLPFTVPPLPGKYPILVDLVVSGRGWFHAEGSEPLNFELEAVAEEPGDEGRQSERQGRG